MSGRVNPLIPKNEHKSLDALVWGISNPINLIKICYRYCSETKKMWKSLDGDSQGLIEQRINNYIMPTFTGYYNFSYIQYNLIKLELKYTFVKVLTNAECRHRYFNEKNIVEEKIFEGSPLWQEQFTETLPEKIQALMARINRFKAEVLPVKQLAKKYPSSLFSQANQKFLTFLQKFDEIDREKLKKTNYFTYALIYQELKKDFEESKQKFNGFTRTQNIAGYLLEFDELILNILQKNNIEIAAEEELFPAFVVICSLLNHPLSWEIADALEFYCYKKEQEKKAEKKPDVIISEEEEKKLERELQLATCFKAYVKAIMVMDVNQLERELQEILSPQN